MIEPPAVAPRPAGRREQNRQEKLRRIVGAARELFHEKGFELTTTQEVANRAGLGVGTLFIYVSTKEDLLILAFVDEMAEVAQRAYAGLDRTAPFADQMADFFYGVFGYHRANVALTKFLLREVGVVRNVDLLDKVRGLPIRDLLVSVVRRAQAAGDLREDIDPGDIAALMFATHWDCLREWINGALADTAFRERVHRMVALQVGGVGFDEARPERPARRARDPRRWATRRRP